MNMSRLGSVGIFVAGSVIMGTSVGFAVTVVPSISGDRLQEERLINKEIANNVQKIRFITFTPVMLKPHENKFLFYTGEALLYAIILSKSYMTLVDGMRYNPGCSLCCP
jgi:hypothetical protein